MTKVFGTKILGIAAATAAFYLLGYLIYGVLFEQQWLQYAGITEADVAANNARLGPMMWVWGIVITLAQVLGLSWVLQYAHATQPMTCARIAATVAVLFVLPILTYNWLYAGSSVGLLRLDFFHLLAGYVLSGLILSFFRTAT